MKQIFTFIYKTTKMKKLYLYIICFLWITSAKAQKDTTEYYSILNDTTKQKLNMDAVYDRPFILAGKNTVAIGGYLEANTNYTVTDGVAEGFSFQMRRVTLFFSSTVGKRIKFLSELEFEDGTKEINMEFAALDLEINSLLNFRGGILMNPIGAFNQNHDGPKWDFIDRPISATELIPSTLSNVGFGVFGKTYRKGWTMGYELYLTNGFDDKIISNESNRTSLKAGKSNVTKFEESPSGLPYISAKVAIKNRRLGEIGFSTMHGVYNTWQKDGIEIEPKRHVSIIAVDFNTAILKQRLGINGELTQVIVDIPETYGQVYGKRQFGGYVDFVGCILKRKILDWDKARINLLLRAEYVDFNQAKFTETQTNIGDHIFSLVPGISFRPVGPTVIRLNYRFMEQTDLFENPASRTGNIQFGFSSYF